MSDQAPATAAQTANQSPAAQQAGAEQHARAQVQQGVQDARESIEDAWSKAVEAESSLPLKPEGEEPPSLARDGDGSDPGDAPPPEKAAPPPEKAATKASRFAQAVREKARQSREMQARREQLERENARLLQQQAEWQRQQELLRTDPVAFYRAQGKTAEEISSILLQSATEATPEAEVRRLKDQVQQLIERDRQREEAQRRQQRQAQDEQIWRKFIDGIGSSPDYPLMASTPEPLVRMVAMEVAKAFVANGGSLDAFDDQDFADGIELWLQNNRRQAKAAAKGDAGQGSVERAGKSGDGRPAPRTATPDLTARRYSLPKDFRQMSRDQQLMSIEDAWSKAQAEESGKR